MSKEVYSILDFDGGAIAAKVDYDLKAVMDNIRDMNTDDKARTLTVKISLKPDEKRRTVVMTSQVSKSLRPTKPTSTTMQLSMVNGQLVGTEVADFMDGQIDLDGVVKESKIIKFPISNSN